MRGTAGTQQEVINMSQSAFLTQHYSVYVYIKCFLYYDIIDPLNTHMIYFTFGKPKSNCCFIVLFKSNQFECGNQNAQLHDCEWQSLFTFIAVY